MSLFLSVIVKELPFLSNCSCLTYFVNVSLFFREKYLIICGYYFTCFTALLVASSHIVWSSLFFFIIIIILRKSHSHLLCFGDHTHGKSSMCYFVFEFWMGEKKKWNKNHTLLMQNWMLYMVAAVHTKTRRFCDFIVLFHDSLVSVVNLLPQKTCQKYLEYVPLRARWTMCNLYFNC